MVQDGNVNDERKINKKRNRKGIEGEALGERERGNRRGKNRKKKNGEKQIEERKSE